jgi:small subunit ribosomal protein S2
MSLPQIIKELLESGVHFGHLRKHWNPKMERFIFGRKKNIYIIDLQKTAKKLEEAKEFVKKVASEGKKILFVGTKRQLREVIKEEAISCGMPYVVERWVGGFLTNFNTIRERIKTYKELLEKRSKGEFEKLPHKEVVRLNRQIEKMERNYSGVVNLEELPGCIYVVDPKREFASVKEANKLSIPVVALIDTDADPDIIDYPIPGNDDAIKSVRYITSSIAKAIREGLEERGEIREEEQKEEEKEVEPDVGKYEDLEDKIVEKEEKEMLKKRLPNV